MPRRSIMPCIVLIALMLTLLVACSAGPGSETAAGPTKPASLPPLDELYIVGADSPFRQPLPPSPGLHPDNDLLVESLIASEHLVISKNQFSMTVFFADASTAPEAVQLDCADVWGLGFDRIVDIPIPPFAEPTQDVDGADMPIDGCGEDLSQDNLMTVFDVGQGCMWDFWQTRGEAGAREASYAVGFPLGESGILPYGSSARASGFAFVPGALWPEELEKGRIEHVLFFAYPYTKSGGPVAPATDSDGITDDPSAIPIGAMIQLDPGLDLEALGLEPYERTIARAMQEYGMILVDTGGQSGIGLYAINPASTSVNPWEGLLPDDDFVLLENIPLESLRVLDFGPQDPDYVSKLRPPDNFCSTFE